MAASNKNSPAAIERKDFRARLTNSVNDGNDGNRRLALSVHVPGLRGYAIRLEIPMDRVGDAIHGAGADITVTVRGFDAIADEGDGIHREKA